MATSQGGVKALHDNGVSEIPREYIKPLRSRPQPTSDHFKAVPVIDISRLEGDEELRKAVVQEIASAAQNWGFFQVMNHGISATAMSNMMHAAEDFFNMPVEDKAEYYSEDYKIKMRYCTSFVPSVEEYHDWQDHIHHYFPPFGDEHPWPLKPPSYRPAAEEYLNQAIVLGNKLMPALSEGLGLEANYVREAFGKDMQIAMRVNYYPPCPRPELAVGLSPHADFGGFTILMQNAVGGLQVKHDGQWYFVDPLPGVLVVNISDQLQALSNGIYRSAEHRAVVNCNETRISVGTFFEPSDDAIIAPAPELLRSHDAKPAFEKKRYGDFLAERWTRYLGYDREP